MMGASLIELLAFKQKRKESKKKKLFKIAEVAYVLSKSKGEYERIGRYNFLKHIAHHEVIETFNMFKAPISASEMGDYWSDAMLEGSVIQPTGSKSYIFTKRGQKEVLDNEK